MKLEVTVAKATQTAIPELGQKEKTLWYLIIGTGETKAVINVGEKTYKTVENLTQTTQEALKQKVEENKKQTN